MLLIKAGDPFRLALSEPVKSAEVQLPDGSKRTLTVDAKAAEIAFGDTARQGIYHLRAGTNNLTFTANLLDSAESNIRPRDELKFGEFTRVMATWASTSRPPLNCSTTSPASASSYSTILWGALQPGAIW